MDDRDLYWLAGLMEGEGCFGVYRKDSRHSYASVQINMTDRDVLERLAVVIGHGRVCGPYGYSPSRPDHWQPYFSWRSRGRRAEELMRLLLPLMGERRAARIREVLASCATRAGSCNARATL